MKTLKFAHPLPELILEGEKTTTWRINDDKDFQVGEIILLCYSGKNGNPEKEKISPGSPGQARGGQKEDAGINSEGQSKYEEFAQAKIVDVKMTTFGKLDENDYNGHEKFSSEKEMYTTYSKYYNLEVTSETEVKIIKFILIK